MANFVSLFLLVPSLYPFVIFFTSSVTAVLVAKLTVLALPLIVGS